LLPYHSPSRGSPIRYIQVFVVVFAIVVLQSCTWCSAAPAVLATEAAEKEEADNNLGVIRDQLNRRSLSSSSSSSERRNLNGNNNEGDGNSSSSSNQREKTYPVLIGYYQEEKLRGGDDDDGSDFISPSERVDMLLSRPTTHGPGLQRAGAVHAFVTEDELLLLQDDPNVRYIERDVRVYAFDDIERKLDDQDEIVNHENNVGHDGAKGLVIGRRQLRRHQHRHRLETATNSQIQLHWPKQSGCDLCRHGSCEGM